MQYSASEMANQCGQQSLDSSSVNQNQTGLLTLSRCEVQKVPEILCKGYYTTVKVD